MPKPKALVKERNSPRGLVPSSSFGVMDRPFNSYLSELDPRGDSSKSEELRYALACSRDVRFNEFLGRLGEPRYSRYSLAALAKTCDISLPEFAEFWQSAQKQRALARAQEALPDLVVDLAADAQNKRVCCDRCDGIGWVRCEAGLDQVPGHVTGLRQIGNQPDSPWIRDCPQCSGSGSTDKTGDVDSRKLLLEMTGLTGKRAPMIQLNQNFGGMGIEAAQERMKNVSFEVDAIEVEPVEESASGS